MLKEGINITLNAIATVFICAFLAIAVLFCFGIKPYIVLSGSMEPKIHTGSLAFVNTKAEYEDVRVGDIIAFEISTGATVTHRAITKTANGIETKGDNNEVTDGITTTEENFKGQTLISLPYLGYAFAFIQTMKGRIIAVTGFILFIMLEYITSDKEEKQKPVKTE